MRMNDYQAMAQRTANAKTRSGKIENGILGLCRELDISPAVMERMVRRG